MAESSGDAMSRFVDLFLQGVALQRVLRYLCETSSGRVVDPITDVVCVMITSPLQLMITEVTPRARCPTRHASRKPGVP